VSENMENLKQGQLKAFADQDHEAHLAVHMAYLQDPRIQEMVGQSQFAQPIMAAMQAHIAEHLGFAYRQKIEIQMGVNLPKAGEEVPPEVEQVLAQVEAMAAAKVLADGQAEAAQKQAQQQAEDPVIQMQQAEVQIKAQEAQRKAQKDMADAAMKAARLELDKERLESSERIAGAKIMAEMTANNADIDLKRGTELLNAGIDLMEKATNGI